LGLSRDGSPFLFGRPRLRFGLDWASGQTLNKEKMGNASGKDRRGKNLIEYLKEAQCAVQVRAIKGAAENQKSEGASSYTGVGRTLVSTLCRMRPMTRMASRTT
jgi:hypothetical protein